MHHEENLERPARYVAATPHRQLVTLQGHILEQQAHYPEATGTFSWILSALSISAKMIAAQVRRARLDDVLGTVGSENVQGEQQQKLDVIANEILLRTLGGREGVAIVASEENEEPVILRTDLRGEQKYCVLFDPLDGSSNLDVCGGVGTIFSILRQDRRSARAEDSLLQPGAQQVAAGYVLYGPSTVFVLTIGRGVDLFVLDPAYGAFMRVEQGVKIPRANKSYSLNEGNRLTFPEGYQRYLDWAQSRRYSSRYAGAMVADVHRILLQGRRVPVSADEEGARTASCASCTKRTRWRCSSSRPAARRSPAPGQRILDVQPTDIHQRTPVILGSPDEVDHVVRHLAERRRRAAASRVEDRLEPAEDHPLAVERHVVSHLHARIVHRPSSCRCHALCETATRSTRTRRFRPARASRPAGTK